MSRNPANKVVRLAYYILEPAVAGGLGEGTVMDSTVHPPRAERLHYEFEDWRLVVSDQALALLREFNINNCNVEPFQP